MSYKELPLAPHLFKYHCPSKRIDPPTFIIKNSSKKKVRNRAQLRHRYAQHLLALVQQFDQSADAKMIVHYPPRYIYKFEKVDDEYVQVSKARFERRPWFHWVRYPRGKLNFARGDVAGQRAYLRSIRTPDCTDLLDLAIDLADRKFCCFCGRQITCINDLYDLDHYEFMLFWERKALPPIDVDIANVCIRCQAKVQAGELTLPPDME